MPPTATSSPPTGQRCRLSIAARAESDVVVRVLVLLRRRGCTVVAVDFRRADRHGPGCFEVSVEAPSRIRASLEDWLMGLVDVGAVGPG
jgi:acetolactate synthase regulatory subunit